MIRLSTHLHVDDEAISVDVDKDGNCLTIRFKSDEWPISNGDLFLYCKSLDAILDLGYAIIAAVNKIKQPIHDFDINDAVNSEGVENRDSHYAL